MEDPPAVVITPCDPWPRPYYLEGGLRRVAPYHFTYNTYCKERWRGKELLAIFASEFRDRSEEYYVCLFYFHLFIFLYDFFTLLLGFNTFFMIIILTRLERCHRTRSGDCQWKTSSINQSYRQKWRCHIAYTP